MPDPEPNAPSLLVVDDDAEIGALLSGYLGRHGFAVDVAGDGAQLRARIAAAPAPALVLLDLGLPGEDGLSLLRHLRAVWDVPVIVVSGRGETVERVVGLELGADDYVAKPFDLRELLARIRSVLRRSEGAAPSGCAPGERWEFAGFSLSRAARRLLDRDGREIELTGGEYALLVALLEQPQRVLTRDQLMTAIHGREAGPFDRTIDVQVARLRRKIETDAAAPRLIRSVRGAGYLFAADVRRR